MSRHPHGREFSNSPILGGKDDEIANSINRNSAAPLASEHTQIYLIYFNLQPAGVRVDLNFYYGTVEKLAWIYTKSRF